MMVERIDTQSAYWVRYFLGVRKVRTIALAWFYPHVAHVLGISVVY